MTALVTYSKRKRTENNTITKLVGAQMAYGFTHDCYILMLFDVTSCLELRNVVKRSYESCFLTNKCQTSCLNIMSK